MKRFDVRSCIKEIRRFKLTISEITSSSVYRMRTFLHSILPCMTPLSCIFLRHCKTCSTISAAWTWKPCGEARKDETSAEGSRGSIQKGECRRPSQLHDRILC